MPPSRKDSGVIFDFESLEPKKPNKRNSNSQKRPESTNASHAQTTPYTHQGKKIYTFKSVTGKIFYTEQCERLPSRQSMVEKNKKRRCNRFLTILTEVHQRKLEEAFTANSRWGIEKRQAIAQMLNLTEQSVDKWLVQRRKRNK